MLARRAVASPGQQHCPLLCPSPRNRRCSIYCRSLEPTDSQDALEIPPTEIRRAGLSEYKRLWIILDEYNRDELEASFYFEPNASVGSFSKAFLKVMSARFAQAIREQRASMVNRKD